jgi:DNA-binding beta-propeller fold protein YncE
MSMTPVFAVALAVVSSTIAAPEPGATKEPVGREGERTVLPVNQVLTPLGRQLDYPGRPQVIALSPDGKLLVASGKTAELIVLDAATGQPVQRVAMPDESLNEPHPDVVSPNILKPDAKAQVSFTGLVFSPDGKRIFLSNVNGSVKVFAVGGDGKVSPSHSLPLPLANAPRRKQEIPAGLALSSDAAKLYVCGNLSNMLLELDAATGRVLRTFDVGVAPYDVAIVGGKAYVSNWGGRRAGSRDLTGPAGRGTVVRVDPVRHIASEGSVSIVDLAGGKTAEIITGLHASALAVSPDGRYVVCANAGVDNLSVIDIREDKIVETIWAKDKPSDLLGATPNALAFSKGGSTLYVANGTQNAVAVIDFDPAERESKLRGLIPVGWFPGALVLDKTRDILSVANIKGHPALKRKNKDGTEGFNSHHYTGSISLVPLPKDEALPKLTETVLRNLRREAIVASKLPPRPDQPARPVPERIGEPSVFKHVVYVIKENRTYDQVLGDIAKGNGDPELCIFGEKITPNQHKLANDFVLLDNTYCSGILSADGHQWSTTAFATDYMEKSFAGFPRSYPDGMGEDEADALAYSPGGFLWDNVLKHKKTLRNYGEFAAPDVKWRDPKRKGSPKFLDCYRKWKGENDDVIFASYPMVDSLKPYVPTDYVGWSMEVPDQFRADFVIRELKQFEEKGELPNLILICLPNDHTNGTSPSAASPAAYMADNDLAFGRIVEAFSHSKFWKETAIFAIEDDPQAGWDHVSGYRTTAYCISPYTKRGEVISTQYNTTSIIRTIEQILGLPPMNQFDASATPMSDCFKETPDFTPFKALPANVPLDQMNTPVQLIKDALLKKNAMKSATLNFREVDKAPEDVLNRILWHAMKGNAAPYPEWAAGRDDD